MGKNTAILLRSFKLLVPCMDLTPCFWRILAILWSILECWPVAFCQIKVSLTKSQILLSLLCPEFSIAQGGNVFSFGMRISARGSALKQSVLNSGVEVILYTVYMGQCLTIWEIHMPHLFFLILCGCCWYSLVKATPSLGSAMCDKFSTEEAQFVHRAASPQDQHLQRVGSCWT